MVDLAGARPMILADLPTVNLDSQVAVQVSEGFRELVKSEPRALFPASRSRRYGHARRRPRLTSSLATAWHS